MTASGLPQVCAEEFKADLQLILNSMLEGLYGVDELGHCTFCNHAFLEMTGYQAAEVIGQSLHRLVHHSHRDGSPYPEAECTIRAAWKQKRSVHLYGEYLWRKDGTCFPVEFWSHPLPSRTHAAVQVATLLDITEREQAAQALRTSEESHRRLLANIPDVIWTSDQYRRTTYISPNVQDSFGYTPAEICAQGEKLWRTRIHPEDRERVMAAYGALFADKRAFDEEYRVQKKDGAWMWVRDRALRTHELNGLLYADGLFSDITERKQALMALEEAHLETETFLNVIPTAIIATSGEGIIARWNLGAADILGVSKERAVSHHLADCGVEWLDPAQMVRFEQEMLEKGEAKLDHLGFKGAQQDKRLLGLKARFVAGYDGKSDGFIITAADVTQRKLLETQLGHTQKMEAIGQLSAGIAHEINTPTQFVADNLTFLRDSWKSANELLVLYRETIKQEEARFPETLRDRIAQAESDADLEFLASEIPRAIEQALYGVQRVAKIVGAMKEFSHPDSSEKTPVDINKAIETTVTVARNEWKYVADVETDFDTNLVPVLCYSGELNQVVLNLIVNAAHAIKDAVAEGQKGLITISTRQRGTFAEIAIADSGTGIPEAIRSRVFDPFFTTKEVGKGTGQGLALAHSIVVKKHGGKIWFESEVGRGTTFFIHLPVDNEDRAGEK